MFYYRAGYKAWESNLESRGVKSIPETSKGFMASYGNFTMIESGASTLAASAAASAAMYILL